MQNDTEIVRKRGRPRQFDEAAALDRVRDVFIEKGFAEASLDDLSAATGLNRPSIYGAFGDKERLYLTALAREGARALAALRAALAAPGPIEERLSESFARAIADYCAPPNHPGCMIVGTAAAAALTHPAIAEAARRLRRETEDALETAFARCVANRELPADPAPAVRARLAVAMLDTLAVRARLGDAPGELGDLAQDSLALICRI